MKGAPRLLAAPCSHVSGRVAVERGVQFHDTLGWHGFDDTVTAVAPERFAAGPREHRSFDERILSGADQHSSSDVETGFDLAVVAQGNTDASVRADQAALTDSDLLRAAAGKRAHDGRAAADIAAIVDRDTLADTSFHHRLAERAGIEVDEAFMHHRGTNTNVGPEAYAIAIGNAHASRNHEVEHRRKLVHRPHDERIAIFRHGLLRSFGVLALRDRAGIGPAHVRK